LLCVERIFLLSIEVNDHKSISLRVKEVLRGLKDGLLAVYSHKLFIIFNLHAFRISEIEHKGHIRSPYTEGEIEVESAAFICLYNFTVTSFGLGKLVSVVEIVLHLRIVRIFGKGRQIYALRT
jgi:hypothetical protein